MVMDTLEEIKQILKELSLSQKETDAKFKETDKQLKELGKQIGGLGNKFGSFTEGLAYPSLQKILLKYYQIENTSPRFSKSLPDGNSIEYDVFGFTNGKANNAVVVEVKSHLKYEHVIELADELKKFREYFPAFKDLHLYGILATVHNIDRDLKKHIFSHGLHFSTIHNEVFDFEKNENAVDFNA
jgi:hypothetical protein